MEVGGMSVTSDPVDIATLKKDFPILERTVHGKPLVYLDSASTSQKPRSVIDTMTRYYETFNANVHRGVFAIAEEATNEMEGARDKLRAFIGAKSTREIVFTKNATESLNLVSNTWGRANLRPGDVVVLTELEHHSNIVPWQILKRERDIELRYIPVGDDGLLDLEDLDRLLDGAKLVSFSAMSNVLGTITPVRRIADAAHAAGATVALDACQFVPHALTNVAELGVDLLAFSGHKMLGPTGIGVLWGREQILDAMPPFLGGGSMIRDVRLDDFTPNELPWKFEAGTPPIAEAIGLGAAVDYLSRIGMEAVRRHEVELSAYTMRTLTERFGDQIRIYGPSEPSQRGAVFSFGFRDLHPHDISQIVDQQGVCVRAGHHCAKPLMRVLGIGATARASLYIYNDESDVDALADALDSAAQFFDF
jgi:cysteine desulfurase/selenocysteine lyase